ncbi:MAG: TRAP transporter small permease [Synergistaceae bacterium]|nr:TRAP transporter small permease [Synergistaceae bacterium]
MKDNFLERIYTGIGAAAMGLLAGLVIFTVIARYCFSLSWKSVSEFNVTLFAFTTFWGMGVNVLKDEHVSITILSDKFSPAIRRWLSIINGFIVLLVDCVFVHYSWLYAQRMGKQISQGMEIPMLYMYGIMPVCGIICALCIIIKIIQNYKAPLSKFAVTEQEQEQVQEGENL